MAPSSLQKTEASWRSDRHKRHMVLFSNGPVLQSCCAGRRWCIEQQELVQRKPGQKSHSAISWSMLRYCPRYFFFLNFACEEGKITRSGLVPRLPSNSLCYREVVAKKILVSKNWKTRAKMKTRRKARSTRKMFSKSGHMRENSKQI